MTRITKRVQEKNSFGISVFGYETKKKTSNRCIKKCCKEKHVDLLLIGAEGKRHHVLIENFNTFMHDHSLHHGKNYFCCYCLQGFSIEEILKRHIKDCFKINV